MAEVTNKVEELSRNCTDQLISTPDIVFDDLKTVRLAGEAHLLRPRAQSLMATRLGIPMQYLQRCPAEVQAYNLNHWIMQERNPELLFRFDGNEVRAIFTPRYRPMDNLEILERLTSLGYKADTRVQCCLDAEFMSLSFPDSSKTFDLGGDRITPGLSICNSEVGISSLKIAAFYLRLVCTNGLIAKTQVAIAYRHVSGKSWMTSLRCLPRSPSSSSGSGSSSGYLWKTGLMIPRPPLRLLTDNLFYLKRSRKLWTGGGAGSPARPCFISLMPIPGQQCFNGLPAASSYRLQSVGGQILAMVK